MFYGDRSGGVKDPSGNSWFVATHKEDVAPQELAKRADAFNKQHKSRAALNSEVHSLSLSRREGEVWSA